MFNLIRNAINCGWGTEDRQTIVQELWSDIRDMSVNLLDDAVMIGKHKARFVLKKLQLKFSCFSFLLKGTLKICTASWRLGRRFVYISPFNT